MPLACLHDGPSSSIEFCAGDIFLSLCCNHTWQGLFFSISSSHSLYKRSPDGHGPKGLSAQAMRAHLTAPKDPISSPLFLLQFLLPHWPARGARQLCNLCLPRWETEENEDATLTRGSERRQNSL